MQTWLAARRVRGRGGMGSLADEVGPWPEEGDGVPARVVGTERGGGNVLGSGVERQTKKEKKKKKKEKKKKKKKRRRSSPSNS